MENVKKMAENVVRTHREMSPAQQCAILSKEARCLPDFAEFVNALLEARFQDMIYTERSALNRETLAKIDGKCVPLPKVKVLDSKGVRDAYAHLYGYFVAGRTLGSILGKDLPYLADVEMNTAQGYLFRYRLLNALAEMVPAEKTVQESVKPKVLERIFNDCQGAIGA